MGNPHVLSIIALSLGMVGALSIIRFRTAIKDPKDIVFTFWSIAVGIISGAGLYMIAIVGVPVIGLLLLVLERTSFRGPDPYLLVIHYASEAEEAVQAALPRYRLRSRTVNADGVEFMVWSLDTYAPGDKVTVELTPYDLTKGRIIFRAK